MQLFDPNSDYIRMINTYFHLLFAIDLKFVFVNYLTRTWSQLSTREIGYNAVCWKPGTSINDW